MIFDTDENYQINKYFKLYEFIDKKYIKDGKKINIDTELINKLYDLRELINKPIYINSGYRTFEQNKLCNGATNSYHLNGQAVDIFANIDNFLLAMTAAKIGFNGIIIYDNFIHCDVRKNLYFKKGEKIIIYGNDTNF